MDDVSLLSSVDTLEGNRSEYYDILSADHRRAVLRYLASVTESEETELPVTVSVDELAERIAGTLDGESTDRSESDIRISLHHCHLPKLADSGVIEYDTRRHTVRFEGHSFVAALVDERL